MLEMPQKYRKEPFKHISSGDEHNILVTLSGKVFGLGKNQPYQSISPSQEEYLYFEPITTDLNSYFSACGPQHSFICDSQRLPYSWGNLSNGRCGHVLSSSANNVSILNISMLSRSKIFDSTKCIGTPTLIENIALLLSDSIRKKKEEKRRNRTQEKNQQV